MQPLRQSGLTVSAKFGGSDRVYSEKRIEGPSLSRSLADNIRGRVVAARAEGVPGEVPADMVTSSGSGLDPDISPENALAQVNRIATARGLPAERVRALVAQSIARPTLGIMGSPHVNVLLINRQLAAMRANTSR